MSQQMSIRLIINMYFSFNLILQLRLGYILQFIIIYRCYGNKYILPFNLTVYTLFAYSKLYAIKFFVI